ncbi:MAG: rhodanese-like domain-containing protein [Alphaproteobacteria bacterium]
MTATVQPFPPQPIEIDVDELARRIEAGEEFVLLDVREPQELAVCSIDGHTHIPMQQIPSRLSELPADTPLVVLCHHGGRSMQVTMFLRQQGYENATNLAGGIDQWAARVDPSMARY